MTNKRRDKTPFPDLHLPKWPKERKKAPNIMVLDTCSLIHLATQIPEKFFDPEFPKDKRPKTYLDLLKLLPKEVVGEIHIPDIVVEEVTGDMPFRDSSTGALGVLKLDKHTQKKFSSACAIKEFLRKSLRDEDPFITIQCSSRVANYFHELADLIIEYEDSREVDHIKLHKHKKKTFDNLQKIIDKRHGDGFGLGEIMCAEHSLNYAIKHHASVAMVTEDCWGQRLFLDNIRKHSHGKEIDAYQLNVRGVLLALRTAGLLHSVGIRDDVLVTEHVEYIHSMGKNHEEGILKDPVDKNFDPDTVQGAFTRMVNRSVRSIGPKI